MRYQIDMSQKLFYLMQDAIHFPGGDILAKVTANIDCNIRYRSPIPF